MAYTARLCFEGVLSELSKVKASTMLLEDFNYYFNKTINLYVNKRYNLYDVNLLTTDDLRVLKSGAILKPNALFKENMPWSDPKFNIEGKTLLEYGAGNAKLFGGTYEITLPSDYLHMLNCICIYNIKKRYKCYNKGDQVLFAAKRLTSDSWSTIVNDYYNRPLPTRPYYYIHNVNLQSDEAVTNEYNENILGSTDQWEASQEYNEGTITLGARNGANQIVKKLTAQILEKTNNLYKYQIVGIPLRLIFTSDVTEGTYINLWYDESNSLIDTTNQSNFLRFEVISTSIPDNMLKTDSSVYPRTINFKNYLIDTVDRPPYSRTPNPTLVRCEIRYGSDSTVFELEAVLIDYLKAPLQIRLTLELIDLTEDTSLIMEFPDYVCQEIINELVILMMERDADPRTQSHQAVSLSIATPAQQLAQVRPSGN